MILTNQGSSSSPLDYNQGKGNNDLSQLEFHQTGATGLSEKMSVFTRLSKRAKRIWAKQLQSESERFSNSNDSQMSFELENLN